MPIIIALIPSFLTEVRFGYLYGEYSVDSNDKSEIYYILDIGQQITRDCIGFYSSKSCDDSSFKLPESNNWLSLKLIKKELVITKVIRSGVQVDLENCGGVICILYEYSKFLKSELLLKNSNSRCEQQDHFQKLTKYIHKRNLNLQIKNRNRIRLFCHSLLTYLVYIVLHISSGFSKINPLLKYSYLFCHCKDFIDNFCWALVSLKKEKRLSLRVGNYAVSMIFDICAGVFFLNWLMSIVTADYLPQLLLDTAEVVVETLLDLLKWLMGVPAGLKLNFALNNTLGRFFMYHINLWWTFLVITKPLLEFTFRLFLVIGQLGVTFQVSILADLLGLVSFHIYCIYVYAARLYNLQVMGLIALWRLFIGKKWNPLRERVDSCTYSSEQLFVGTLAFTILFFLLPTTVMYYIVFATLRVMVLAFGGCLEKVRQLVLSLPLYSSLLWLLGGESVASSIQLAVLPSTLSASSVGDVCYETSICQQITMSVTPTILSWWPTICTCMPIIPHHPPYNSHRQHRKREPKNTKLEWKNLLADFFSGRLIYPV